MPGSSPRSHLFWRDPAAVLFHGDAAILPLKYRPTLLDAINREDPQSLRRQQPIARSVELAGSDLAILTDPDKSDNHKALVMMALRAGTQVPELTEMVYEIFATDGTAITSQTITMRAYANIAGLSRETQLRDPLAS